MRARGPRGKHTWDTVDILALKKYSPRRQPTRSYQKSSTIVPSQILQRRQSSIRQRRSHSAHLARDE